MRSFLLLCSLAAVLPGALAAYHRLDDDDLGGVRYWQTAGNPMRGLMTSPYYVNPKETFPYYEADIDCSLEFYYIGFADIMKGNPANVGHTKAFDWSKIDNALSGSASRNMHAVFRVIISFPGKPLSLPQYLKNAGVKVISTSMGPSPADYSDPKLQQALQQFINALGNRYDGDKRIFTIQAGLLGYWGEWHAKGGNRDPDSILPNSARINVAKWFDNAFDRTHIQIRKPYDDVSARKFGFHDDSFAGLTVDGPANGGVYHEWFFWPTIVDSGYDSNWMNSPMGGETRADLQNIVFESDYNGGSYKKQDFMTCVRTVHNTFIFHHAAFKDGGFRGTELSNAKAAHSKMGYSFYVPQIEVDKGSDDNVDIDVTLTQVGVAPFYYPLNLQLRCPGMTRSLGGANKLAYKGESKIFSYKNVPATSECLGALSLELKSPYVYDGRPIKFAQQNGRVDFRLRLPNGSWPTPTPPSPSPPSPSPPTPPGSVMVIDATKNDSKYVTSTRISGSSDGPRGAYGSHRWNTNDFTYTIPGLTPNKTYTVKLGWSEEYTKACSTGVRKFGVKIQGQTVENGIDIFAKAGCKQIFNKSYNTRANGSGQISIVFVDKNIQNPMISRIEIIAI